MDRLDWVLRAKRAEAILKLFIVLAPSEEPQWHDCHSSANYDDIEKNGWDCCAWDVAEKCRTVLARGEQP